MRIGPWKMDGAGQVELAAFVGLIRATRKHMEKGDWDTALRAREVITEWFKVPKTGALVAKGIGDKIEGVLMMRGEAPGVRILHMGCAPKREGIGTQLLTSILTMAKSKGIAEIRVLLVSGDAIQEGFFLKKHGFTTRGDLVEKDGVKWIEAVKPVA